MRLLPTATRVPANQAASGWIGNTLTIRLRYILVDVDTRNWIGLVTLDQDGPFHAVIRGCIKGGQSPQRRGMRGAPKPASVIAVGRRQDIPQIGMRTWGGDQSQPWIRSVYMDD